MDICKVKKLIELLEEFGIDELEICEGEELVCISCYSKIVVQLVYVQVLVFVVLVLVVVVLVVVVVESVLVVLKLNGNVVCLLMVGIFYCVVLLILVNFVEVGQSVKKGDILCIVEVMKMMNYIEVEVSGIIELILVENGQLVEFDQLLFIIV